MRNSVARRRSLDQENVEVKKKTNIGHSCIGKAKSNIEGNSSESSAALLLICSPRLVYRGS